MGDGAVRPVTLQELTLIFNGREAAAGKATLDVTAAGDGVLPPIEQRVSLRPGVSVRRLAYGESDVVPAEAAITVGAHAPLTRARLIAGFAIAAVVLGASAAVFLWLRLRRRHDTTSTSDALDAWVRQIPAGLSPLAAVNALQSLQGSSLVLSSAQRAALARHVDELSATHCSRSARAGQSDEPAGVAPRNRLLRLAEELHSETQRVP